MQTSTESRLAEFEGHFFVRGGGTFSTMSLKASNYDGGAKRGKRVPAIRFS